MYTKYKLLLFSNIDCNHLFFISVDVKIKCMSLLLLKLIPFFEKGIIVSILDFPIFTPGNQYYSHRPLYISYHIYKVTIVKKLGADIYYSVSNSPS